jgi:glucokinase
MIVLAGDVGGTNARLALAEVNGASVRVLRESRYNSRDYPGLGPIVRRFCQEADLRAHRACFGVACPIDGDDCIAPNLPWTINVHRLAAEIEIPATTLINDFVAVGHGIELLGGSDLATLQEGIAVKGGPIALIGAGTGLGQGLLLWERTHYGVLPSEGGHADFAPCGALQARLLQFLSAEFGHVSWERLLSGPGLVNIYRYLVVAGVAPEQTAIRAELEREDPAAVIVRHGLARTDPLCDRALDLFCAIYGAQAGNLALTVVATGGVYIAGGIAPRIVDRLRAGLFMTAFRDKGRLSDLVSHIPVHVVINANVGLLGAAAVAGRMA